MATTMVEVIGIGRPVSFVAAVSAGFKFIAKINVMVTSTLSA